MEKSREQREVFNYEQRSCKTRGIGFLFFNFFSSLSLAAQQIADFALQQLLDYITSFITYKTNNQMH